MTSDVLGPISQSVMQAWGVVQARIGVNRLFLLLNLFAVFLLASSMADWTWRFVRPNLPQVVTTLDSSGNQDKHSPDIQVLLNAHLFGKASVVETPATPTEVPLSSLNLVLTGIVAAGDDSVALISADGQPQAAFTLGEEVAHGAILHAVYPDRAILQRAGVLESLVLEDIAEGLSGKGVSIQQGNTVSLDDQIKRIGANDFSVPRNIIGEKLKDPNFLRAAYIMPRKEGGFLVRKLTKGSLYEKIGLKQGDIITSVNGEPLNSIQDAMSHYAKLNTLNQVQVEVTRNGKPEMLQFHLK